MASPSRRGTTEKLPAVKAKKRGRGGRARLIRWLIFLPLAAGVLGLMAAASILYYYGSDPELPRLDRAADYRPKLVTRVLAAGGEVIGEIFEERRTLVPRDKIPDVMIHALLDAEDAQFYEHEGLDYSGMARALLNDLKPGAHLQGASTITQQLVRNLILKSTARTLKRKVQELILARRIERTLSKDEILYLYLNQIEFPYQRFGIEESARFYFGKSVSDVDAGEAALLASLPKGPTEIDPIKHPDRAKDRQRYVLSQMVRYKHIDPKVADQFARAPIKLVRGASAQSPIAPEFVDEVKKILVERFTAKQLPYLGLTVQTTCDARIQKLTRDAVEHGLVDLDGRNGYRKPNAHLSAAQVETHKKKLAKEFPNGPSMGKIVEGVVVALEGDAARVSLGALEGLVPMPVAVDRYNPKGLAADKRFAVGDVVRVRLIEAASDKKAATLALELGPQAAAVVIDPTTRHVKALVGGYGFRPGGFDRALVARRQPGSSFKPFLYAAALSTEKFTPATVLNDSPQVYATPGLQPWQPQNAEKHEYLGPVRLRVALAKSLNTVASQLIDEASGGVGPEAVVALARDAGIESKLQANPSLALGTSEVTPYELTNAYATFAAGGRYRPPVLILKIGDQEEKPRTELERMALTPELAYLVTSMMTSVIEEGTAASARGKLKRPAAGKTGTTDAQRDAWFVGYTPELVTGVWVGFDDMRELGKGEQGARAALPTWTEIMTGALKDAPFHAFAQPPGVIVQRIDPVTGLLPAQGAASTLEEVFLEGTVPTTTAQGAGEVDPDTFLLQQ